jgi:hypothetical protein
MSYDLTFVPRAEGQSWDEALEAAEEHPVDAAGPDPVAWGAILAAARETLGEVDVHRDDDGFELTHEATGIHASYDGRAAAISVPYWYTGDRAAAIVDRLYTLGERMQRATGLTGYDPQVELALTDASTRPELAVASFDTVAEALGR